ncbi:uncharacterized protein BN739_00164 [Ruminococcus sp. CAG:624]|nr:uncharacterized protein BN739_00164 [Ruminococcus sp. CAG:624]
MNDYTFTIVIPTHNEEKYIAKCIKAVRRAEKNVPDDNVQILVVLNRCTDRTEEIARKYGADVIYNSEKCLSKIRNAGVKAAKGRFIVTIDADSMMPYNALSKIKSMLESNEYIGGGARPKFERMSLGILITEIYIVLKLLPIIKKSGGILSATMFWFRKTDFELLGGFNEELVSVEDADFAKRLKALGDSKNMKYGVIKKPSVITSSRKFDEFGDWYLLKNRNLTKAILTGYNKKAADKFYYDVR